MKNYYLIFVFLNSCTITSQISSNFPALNVSQQQSIQTQHNVSPQIQIPQNPYNSLTLAESKAANWGIQEEKSSIQNIETQNCVNIQNNLENEIHLSINENATYKISDLQNLKQSLQNDSMLLEKFQNSFSNCDKYEDFINKKNVIVNNIQIKFEKIKTIIVELESCVKNKQCVYNFYVDAFKDICVNRQMIINLQKEMQFEKSNPSGYVNKTELYDIGKAIQIYQNELKVLQNDFFKITKTQYPLKTCKNDNNE